MIDMKKAPTIHVIGGGLAGSEAAYHLSRRGYKVKLYEMKPERFSPAHESPMLCELVCSNSLKSNDVFFNACGLLKEELRVLGSITMQAAEHAKVPAGAALAVDRERFSAFVTDALEREENVEIIRKELTQIPQTDENNFVIVATGPLTSDALAQDLERLTGQALHFYDASAPIVAADSIDETCSFTGDRYGKGTGDYINCPMNKDEYYAFVDALLSAERAHLHEFEKGEIFEGCMPVEVMASRGKDTLRFGTLKPVGLFGEDGVRPYAAAQLRKENEHGTAYNLVGFQTNLKFPEQKRVFSMIPALKNAEFLRYGVMHRNTYLDAPRVLNADFSFKDNRRLFFAGQITGVEGYVESAASGLLAALHLADGLENISRALDDKTVCGALEKHISTPQKDFEPMNANFGILSPMPVRIRDKKERYRALAERALQTIRAFKQQDKE